MRSLTTLGIAAIASTFAGCTETESGSEEQTEVSTSERTQLGVAELSRADGEPAGTVVLNQEGEALSLEIAINGLEEGEKAFHLHTTGQCSAPDFTSAGGHLNPFGKSHGHLSEDGKHLGDLSNVTIGTDGAYAGTVPIEGQAADIVPLIFDEDGTAVMVHAGPDDYRTDPTGAAGPRIACGVLVRS